MKKGNVLGEPGAPVVEVVAERDGDRKIGGDAESKAGRRCNLHSCCRDSKTKSPSGRVRKEIGKLTKVS